MVHLQVQRQRASRDPLSPGEVRAPPAPLGLLGSPPGSGQPCCPWACTARTWLCPPPLRPFGEPPRGAAPRASALPPAPPPRTLLGPGPPGAAVPRVPHARHPAPRACVPLSAPALSRASPPSRAGTGAVTGGDRPRLLSLKAKGHLTPARASPQRHVDPQRGRKGPRSSVRRGSKRRGPQTLLNWGGRCGGGPPHPVSPPASLPAGCAPSRGERGAVGPAGEFERTDLDSQQWGHCRGESMQAGETEARWPSPTSKPPTRWRGHSH